MSELSAEQSGSVRDGGSKMTKRSYRNMGGVRVVLSHRGDPVPQWLADSVWEKFKDISPSEIGIHDIEGHLRAALPITFGSQNERLELAQSFKRSLVARDRIAKINTLADFSYRNCVSELEENTEASERQAFLRN